MKTLSFLIVALLLTGCAIPTYQPAKETSIENIIDVPGLGKDQIYNASKIWIAENFRSAKAVIEVDDKAAGLIIGNGQAAYACTGSLMCTVGYSIRFTMRIDIKDQKFKATYSNLALTYNGPDWPLPQEAFDNTKIILTELSGKLRSAIEKEPVKANW